MLIEPFTLEKFFMKHCRKMSRIICIVCLDVYVHYHCAQNKVFVDAQEEKFMAEVRAMEECKGINTEIING